jgi:hypothetical protein
VSGQSFDKPAGWDDNVRKLIREIDEILALVREVNPQLEGGDEKYNEPEKKKARCSIQ